MNREDREKYFKRNADIRRRERFRAPEPEPYCRGKKREWVPFELAREVIRAEYLPSKKGYFYYHDRYKPVGIPKYPFNVYKKEWLGWNDWLGVSNDGYVSLRKRVFIDYPEALVYANQLGLKSRAEWFALVDSGGVPPHIPRRPDYAYKGQWTNWPMWLGVGVASKVEAAQVIESNKILACVQFGARPGGVFAFMVCDGLTQLQEKLKGNDFRVIRAFKLDVGYDWRSRVDRGSTPYRDTEFGERLFSNINELLFDFVTDLVIVPVPAQGILR